MNRLHIGKRQVWQIAALTFGHCHQRARHMMCIAKRQTKRAHQPIGKVCCGGKARSGGSGKGGGLCCHITHHARHRGQSQHQGIGGVEGLFFVFLHILGIGQRQPLQNGEQRHRCPKYPPQFRAQQFRCIRIFLLRHDGGTRRPFIRQFDKAELRGGPDHQLLGKARKMHSADAGGGQEFQREISVGD